MRESTSRSDARVISNEGRRAGVGRRRRYLRVAGKGRAVISGKRGINIVKGRIGGAVACVKPGHMQGAGRIHAQRREKALPTRSVLVGDPRANDSPTLAPRA